MAAYESKEDKDWTKVGIDAGTAAGQIARVRGTHRRRERRCYVHRAQLVEINDRTRGMRWWRLE